jgi:plasmid stabilization system protein ParE
MPASTVIFHRFAAREYDLAYKWYIARSVRAAASFERAVDQAVQGIADAPDRWASYGEHYHWVRLRRFPYVLYYRILDSTRVLIVAVAHGRRRLGYWSRRTGV